VIVVYIRIFVLLRTTGIVVIVVITVFVALFLYCAFKIYLAIRLSSRKCVINSVFNLTLQQVALQTSILQDIRYIQSFIGNILTIGLCRNGQKWFGFHPFWTQNCWCCLHDLEPSWMSMWMLPACSRTFVQGQYNMYIIVMWFCATLWRIVNSSISAMKMERQTVSLQQLSYRGAFRSANNTDLMN